MGKKLLDWLKRAVCLVLLGTSLSAAACAWIKAGDQADTPTTAKDGRDAADMDVDSPLESDDSAPAPDRLP